MPITLFRYEAKTFHLQGLDGLSTEQLEQHDKLYQGYVANTNKLNEQLATLRERGKAEAPDAEFAELKRRLGFEYNGMVLHEYYFGNLKANGGDLPKGGKLARAIEESFGSIDACLQDLMGVCRMRGVGWAILDQDPGSGWLNNHWITLHEEGHVAGYRPILVIDLWEHAFTVDYLPTERAKYLAAVFRNVDWPAVEARLA